MGNCMRKKGPGEKLTLAILGLDNAGKTVTTKGLQGGTLDTVAPTVGFSSIDFSFEKYDITMFDLGGGKRIRDIWKNYFAEIYGLVYVIDSSEASRMEECRGVLEKLLKDDKISGKPVLVLANKQDKPGALDEYDICEQLDLEELVNNHKTPCRVELCAAIIGQGKKLDKSIRQGMRWLLGTIEKNHELLDERVKRDIKRQEEQEKKEKREKAERVRKIREERKAKEREERRLRGEPEESEEENDDPINGDPFKTLNKDELAKKEQQLKEEKRRKKEASKGLDETGGRPVLEDDLNTKGRKPLRSMDDTDIFAARLKRPGIDSPRPYRRTSYGQSRSRSPSPNSRDKYGTESSPWNRPLDLGAPLGGSKLPPLGGQSESAPRRGVLAPLSSLEPIESIERRSRKKKKKARKNQTMPGGPPIENGVSGQGEDEVDHSSDEPAPRGWQPANPRASRSPRLDTVTEPDNETGFSQKWGLVDELPELLEEEEDDKPFSSYGPNSDRHDVVT